MNKSYNQHYNSSRFKYCESTFFVSPVYTQKSVFIFIQGYLYIILHTVAEK